MEMSMKLTVLTREEAFRIWHDSTVEQLRDSYHPQLHSKTCLCPYCTTARNDYGILHPVGKRGSKGKYGGW